MRLTADRNGVRLDRWLADKFPLVSRARWQRALDAGLVTRNGHPAAAAEKLRTGDLIEASPPPDAEPPPQAVPEDIPLRVLYEDDDLLCLDKPAGLVVHPAAGHWQGTLVNAVMHHCRSLSSGSHPLRPGIVHRLDKDTSGCILVAKNDAAQSHLARQFARRVTRKTYLAVVVGRPRGTNGIITGAIGRHPTHRKIMTVTDRPGARSAETAWKLLASCKSFSLVECRPKTGRTHQIRVHLKHIGHPVAGDRAYGGGTDFPRQLLHAWKLEIEHPSTGQPLAFEAPVPDDFPLRP